MIYELRFTRHEERSHRRLYGKLVARANESSTALDERADVVLCVHDILLHAVGFLREARSARRRGVVRAGVARLGSEADRAVALGDLCGGRVPPLAYSVVD